MTTRKFTGVLFLSIIAGILFSCKPQEIILHGDISGLITDAETSQPIEAASVKIINTNDSTGTGNDGSFLFKNLTPGLHEIKASKQGYDSIKQNIEVVSAETNQIAISLNGIPVPRAAVTFLDFGLDSTSLRFSISNLGTGKFVYFITPSQDWITLSPLTGNITNDTINIKVTINKTGLSQNIYKENIIINTDAGQTPLPAIELPVYLNGVSDRDGHYYRVTKIGTQIWMAENLNVGTELSHDAESKNNGIIEKYCYADLPGNCQIYGGLYQWNEMMQYNAPDNGLIGTNQGICPTGWHIPTENEWVTLYDYLGGGVAGGKLKETGTKYWYDPNVGASDAVGFSGLPGAAYFASSSTSPTVFDGMGYFGAWWTSSDRIGVSHDPYFFYLGYDIESLSYQEGFESDGRSIRCVKNPAK